MNQCIRNFQNNFGAYCVPILFYKPGSDLKGIKKRIFTSIESLIMPTVLNYFLNYDDEYIGIRYNNLNGWLLWTHSLLIRTASTYKSVYEGSYSGQWSIQNLSDSIIIKPICFLRTTCSGKSLFWRKQMEEKLKAVIQSYNSRLIDNNMVVRKQGKLYMFVRFMQISRNIKIEYELTS